MEFNYFDIHSHLDVSDFDLDREDEIEKMKKQKIGTITVGVDFESSQKEIELAEKYQNIFATAGLHPEDTKEDSIYDARIDVLATNPKVVAIGECGLDYFRMKSEDEKTKAIQKKIFENQVNLSIKLNKPLMLHVRSAKETLSAYHDTLDILEHHAKISGDKLRGNAHFFAGDLDTLKRFLAIGFSVSFTGVITFTHDYDELIKYAPLDMIMSETDSPFVAPVPYRGKRNSPLYIPEVVKKIAEIRDEALNTVKTKLVDNAIKYFQIDLNR